MSTPPSSTSKSLTAAALITGFVAVSAIVHILRRRRRQTLFGDADEEEEEEEEEVVDEKGNKVPKRPSLVIASCHELVDSADGTTDTYGISGRDESNLYHALHDHGIRFDVKAWDDPQAKWEEYKTVWIRTTWDYSYSEARAHEFRRWLARLSTTTRSSGTVSPSAKKLRVYNHPRILSWNVHKDYLRELSETCGIPVIPTVVVRGGTPKEQVDLPKIMKEQGWKNALLKPCVGGGSRACMRVLSDEPDGVENGQLFLLAHTTTLSSSSSATAALPHMQTLHRFPSDDLGVHGGHVGNSSSSNNASANGDGGISSPTSAARKAVEFAEAAAAALHRTFFGGAGKGNEGDNTHSRSSSSAPLSVTTGASTLASSTNNDPCAACASAYFSSSLCKSAASDTTPCDMMIQPYVSSVETCGEISVILIDGEISHALVKVPVKGEYRVQEEHGGVPRPYDPTPISEGGHFDGGGISLQELGALALRVLRGAITCVEKFEPALSPSALDPAQRDTALPRTLPEDAFLCGRVDFLHLTPEAHAQVFQKPDHHHRQRQQSTGETTSPPDPTTSPFLLLELEVVEPCMFFCVDPAGVAADKLAVAVAKRLNQS